MSISAVRSSIVVSPRRVAPVVAAPTRASAATPAEAPAIFDSKPVKVAVGVGYGLGALSLVAGIAGIFTGNSALFKWGLLGGAALSPLALPG